MREIHEKSSEIRRSAFVECAAAIVQFLSSIIVIRSPGDGGEGRGAKRWLATGKEKREAQIATEKCLFPSKCVSRARHKIINRSLSRLSYPEIMEARANEHTNTIRRTKLRDLF